MWEAQRYDWVRLRAMESAIGVPDAIERMRQARSKKESDEAYWRIDNIVVVQERLFEAAVPTAACLVTALPRCSKESRSNFLDLLFQLGNGEPDPSEVALGNAQLAESCRVELLKAYGVYISILEESVASDCEIDIHHCADLLLLCAAADTTLKEQVTWYYKQGPDGPKRYWIRFDQIGSRRAFEHVMARPPKERKCER